MTASRIFVSFSCVDKTSRDYQFLVQLVNDLRTAGADVAVDDADDPDHFAQSLNHALPSCDWVVLVETPEALRSPRVQLVVNTALSLIDQQRMLGVLRVIAEPCDPQEVPQTWATLRVYNASRDYQRGLAGLLLALDLCGSTAQTLSPPPWDSSVLSTPVDDPVVGLLVRSPSVTTNSGFMEDRPAKLPAFSSAPRKGATTVVGQEEDTPTPLPKSLLSRQRPRHLWLLACVILVVCMIILASAAVIAKPSYKPSFDPTATIAVITTTAAIDTPTATTDIKATETADAKATATTRINATATAYARAMAIADANATATANAQATSTANTLTVQIMSIPTQVQNNSVVNVGVSTNEANVSVTLYVLYNAPPYRSFSGPSTTDGSGNASITWDVSVLATGNARSMVVAIAKDQKGQQSQSQPVTVQINHF